MPPLDHDAAQQASYLRQVLAQDKRPLGLLIGAGCPFSLKVGGTEPLIPDIAGLTKVVRAKLELSASDKPLLERLLGHFAEDERASPNVEDYLGHVRALRVVAGAKTVRSFAAAELDQLDDAISRTIVEAVNRDLPDGSTPYATLATWVRAIARDHPVHLFTTNYDLLLEQALERAYVPFFDGFAGAHRPFFDPFAMEEDHLPHRWARIWKLHGSINWRRHPSGGHVTRASDHGGGRFVIHPSHLKYEESRRMPYLAMLDRVRSFFKQPGATLVTCGYRFGDEHLNELLANGLRGNSNATIFGLLFGDLSGYARGVALTTSCPNLTLLAENAAVVGGRQAVWRKAEVPDSESPEPVAYSIAGPGNEAAGTVSFRLGDFVHMGKFLDDLIRDRGGEEAGGRAD